MTFNDEVRLLLGDERAEVFTDRVLEKFVESATRFQLTHRPMGVAALAGWSKGMYQLGDKLAHAAGIPVSERPDPEKRLEEFYLNRPELQRV